MHETETRERLQGLHWECFACGEGNRLGLQLNIKLVEDRTETQFRPTAAFQGAPGVTHSGVVAAVLDEVMTQLVQAKLHPAVTRKVEVTYRRPVRVGQTYTFSARVASEKRRVILVEAEARDENGVQVARARGLYAPLTPEQQRRFLGR